MAIEHLAHVTPEPVVNDLVTLEQCSALLKRTGHPAAVTTLRTWIKKHKVRTVRHSRTIYVSYSDMLPVHRDEVTRRDGPYGS